MTKLLAPFAWLPTGWAWRVLLEWDAQGTLQTVTAEAPAQACIDAPLAAGPVIPGMSNLHSHAFQSAMAGLTEYRAQAHDSFWSWRALMYRFAAQMTPETMQAIAHWLYIVMLQAGYTSVCEFHYLHHQAGGQPYGQKSEMASRLVTAASEAGIGMTLLPVLYQYSDFGARPAREDQARFINDPAGLLSLLDHLRQAHPAHGGLRYGVAPHSLRAVTVATLAELLQGLEQACPDAPVHIHIAEQTGEVDACLATHGARPVQWLLDHFPVDGRWCLVHATHIDDQECADMAATGAILGLCPTTEANLGDGIFPLPAYLAQGGQFGIGSDSHICVDWRAELRLAEYGQRLQRRQRNVLADERRTNVADYLFSRAINGGAQASGRPIAGLQVGQQADFLVLDNCHPSLVERPARAWLSSIVFSEVGGNPIRDVFVGGRPVIQDKVHPSQQAAYAAYRRALRQLLHTA